MSQHFFKTNYKDRPVIVVMGWDKPLQGFFMFIEYCDNNDDDYVYSNLADNALKTYNGLPPTIQHFIFVLSKLRLTVPEKMISEVCSDGSNNVGNKVVNHFS